jgi:hypothetical protein
MSFVVNTEREPVKVIGDVLKAELGLDAGHILLAFEKYTIPQDKGLFVALSYISGKAIGSNNYFTDDPTNGPQETQQVAMQELIQIDVMSFGPDARQRKEEVIQALSSIASQQAQDVNGFQIASIPFDFANASGVEGSSYLQRYTMTVVVKSIRTKTKAAGYYNTFKIDADVDRGNGNLGLFEDTIP